MSKDRALLGLKRKDKETDLHYNRYRYYEPYSARYVSKDPIGLFGGLNNSAYVSDPNQWVDPMGLDETFMDPVFKLIHDTTRYEPSDTTVNIAAGFGDSVSMGGTNWVREKMGTNSGVNKCSLAYNGAQFAGGMMVPTGRVGYVLQAKRIPTIAKTAEEAVKMRNALKISYRKGWPEPFKSNWHISDYASLAAKKTPEQILKRSGGTNINYTVGIVGGGTGVAVAKGVMCD